MEPLRKASQEVEIDHLLAEEFACDPGFGERFLAACGLGHPSFHVLRTWAEPSLGGDGYGDLLVEGEADGERVALLIEDKITAAPATRQAERYAAHAARMREDGWGRVWCILVAPAAYRGERASFDASLDLEEVAALLRSPEPARLAYRQAVIARALGKRTSSGVKVPDLVLHRLKADYLAFMEERCAAKAVALSFPPLKASYNAEDFWVQDIRHPAFPPQVRLRHQLWVSLKKPTGQVDLIASPADAEERARFWQAPPAGATVAPYPKHKKEAAEGVQASLDLPGLHREAGFDPAVAGAALDAMEALVRWYLDGRQRS